MDNFLRKLGKNADSFDKKKLKKAFALAADGGVDVAFVLNVIGPLNPGQDTVIAAVLQRLYSYGKIVGSDVVDMFGCGVLSILMDVNKLEGLNYSVNDRNSQVEVLRKLFLAMAKDMRVIIVGLVYRYYKLNYYEKFGDKKSREDFAKETLNLYVPVSDRLGLHLMKKPLEDLAFKYAYPKDFENVSRALKGVKEKRNVSIGLIKKELEDFFKERDLEFADIYGRMKGYYSVYKKMRRQGSNSLDGLYDIFAIRVVLPDRYVKKKEQLDHIYAALGMMHSKWTPLSTRFKDYLANPKPNGYRSLHTVLFGLAPRNMDQPVEVQIRTEKMHRDAEFGVASHWLYKQSGSTSVISESQAELLKNLENAKSGNDILSEVEVDVFRDKIFVLTPSGEVKSLPTGACPIDFAYNVHTDIGHRCVMAKVDGRVVPLDYELRNGEIVEVVTRKDATPKLQWLSIAKTNGAKNKIKAWFSSLDRENNIRKGRKALNEKLAELGRPPLDQNYSLFRVYLGKKMTVVDRESLVEEVGKGSKMRSEVLKKVLPASDWVLKKAPKIKQKRDYSGLDIAKRVLIGGESDLPVKFSNCCKPKDGDEIVGYVTRGNRVSIHKKECLLLNSLNQKRMIGASWRKKLELS